MTTIEISNKVKNNLNDPNHNNLKKFEIIVELKNNKTFKFYKNTNEKYCNIIQIIDKIKYNNIKTFELTIYDKLLDTKIYSIKEIFNNKTNDEFYILKNYEIYLEFLNINNFLNCSCFLKNKETDNIIKFFTPPNY
jgi:hypothetical protein